MNHKYTIIEGSLIGEEKECKIPFALVFEENGVYFIETFLENSFFEDSDFSKKFKLLGITEKGFEIEIADITFILYKHNNYKAKFVCRNYVKLIEVNKDVREKDLNDREDSIFFIEIEGFKTKFANHTDIKKYRNYGEIKDFNIDFDHTSCSLYIQIEGFRENYFHLVFSKSSVNDNILIDFTKNEGYGRLAYEHYKVFRKQFLSFLSLINGGEVYIRRELTGKFYRIDGSDSQIVYNYSFTKKSKFYTSDYIPINEHHSYSSSIFNQVFLNCFNYFYHYDLKFELISIVSSINSAFSTSGINEAYSILINALEKLSTNYQESIGNPDENLIDNEIWEDMIKPKLIEALDNNKSLINSGNKNAYAVFKSKICDINRKKNSTVQKMYDLFEFGCIPINQNVENLINKERHNAVHKGKFGENSTEMISNYQKLDNILRDLVLNIIDYRSYRKSFYEYATKEERKAAYPKRKSEPRTFFCSQPIRE